MSEHRFRRGLVIGKFYPLHAGHSYLIRTAISACESVTVQVLASVVESTPLEVRAAWIRAEHPGATVVAAYDEAPVDFESPSVWDAHMAVIDGLLDEPVDAVFSSDPYGAELARRLSAEWVQVDPGRKITPISGRAIRADLEGNWHFLPVSVRESLVARVVVLGAESTGSTTLARELAERLETSWVPEYGRLWSEIRPGGLSAPWTSSEFELIVEQQLAWEQGAARTSPRPLIICDTDILATSIWYERYLGQESSALVERARTHPPALYILTGAEIPFEQDGLRDGEHIREDMHNEFRRVLASQEVPWIEVSGSIPERIALAIEAIMPAVANQLAFSVPLELRPR